MYWSLDDNIHDLMVKLLGVCMYTEESINNKLSADITSTAYFVAHEFAQRTECKPMKLLQYSQFQLAVTILVRVRDILSQLQTCT